MTGKAVAAAVVVWVAALSSPAAATEVSAEQLARLAARAGSDDAALNRLKAVTSVEGLPVDLAAALDGVGGGRLEARLEALAGAVGELSSERVAGQRAAARAVLSGPRFREPRLPRPFAGVLQALGRLLRPAGAAVVRMWRATAGVVPGGDSSLWAIAALAVALGGAVGAGRVARRRSRAEVDRVRRAGATELHPARLERSAAEAERAGDLGGALRLLFRAGLLRLDRARAIHYRDSLTTGEVAAELRSPQFDELAASFERVAYGGHPTSDGDVRRARAGWRRLLEELGP